MKRGTIEHPKMGALQETLEIPLREAVGIMECIWHFTARYTPDGAIGKYSDAAIAKALEWTDDAGELIEALVTAGWLERHEKHRLVVHDWSQHADDAVDKKLTYNGENYWDGKAPRRSRNLSRNVGKCPENVETSPEMSGECREMSGECRENVGKCREMSGNVGRMSGNVRPASSQKPVARSQKEDIKRGRVYEGEGDEAHKALVSCPVLSGVTYEQDLKARQLAGVSIKAEGLVELAGMAADEALVLGELKRPAEFWRRRLEAWMSKNKKDAPRARTTYVPLAERGKGEK